jgi:hypothetical protein
MRIIIAALLLFFASACAQLEWARPATDATQVQADLQQCQQDAWHEARVRSNLYGPFGPMMYRDAFGRRVFAGGPFSDPWGDRFMEEARLAQFCMRTKGYELKEVPKS